MRQNYNRHDVHGRFQGTSNAQGLACGLAKAALVVSVALCSGSIAFAEDSHHGAASSGHGDSHSGFSYSYAEGRLINITVDDHGDDLDGTGFEFEGSIGLGVRKKIGEKGEVQFGVNYIDFSEAGSVTSYELVGEMHVLPSLALGVGVTASSEATACFAEARFYFGH